MDTTSLINRMTNYFGDSLPGLLVTLCILIVGIIAAKFFRGLSIKIFNKLGLQSKFGSIAGDVDIAKGLGALVYFVILLNVLVVVLERMGITAVLDPIKALISQFFNVIPNLVGAGIVIYVGWLLAKMVQNVVSAVAVKLDEYVLSKHLDVKFKVSKFLGVFAFVIVLVPIVIQGLDILQFEVVSNPAKVLLSEFLGFTKRLALATVIVSATFYIGKFVVGLIGNLLDGLALNTLPAKLGLESLLPKNMTLVNLVQKITMFFILLTAFSVAVEILQVDILTNVFAHILSFGGKILVGSLILFVGAALANLAYNKLSLSPNNSFMAGIARFAILGLVLSMGLKEMGLADNIVNMAFGLTLGAIAIAFAVSFGVGGIDAARSLSGEWAKRFKK